ncbi:hypothetical protein B0H10DRAFT_1945053 [Mycena sp. CBHHK59/15]|nr:hypothetical protein B0H10DRAFT_1945053 [Mycena sp. CBHHK59/15]
MHFIALAATAAAAVLSVVSAATITVKVGENNGLTYDPANVTAAVGDEIAFQFIAKNHTVTQSTFADPCQQMETPMVGIDSGYQAVAANSTQIPQWSFTVNNATAPLWFFCRQTGHCAKGMVFSVNAPATGKTFDAFKAAAMNTATTGGSASGSGGSASASASSPSGSAAPNGAARLVPGALALAAGLAAGLLL